MSTAARAASLLNQRVCYLGRKAARLAQSVRQRHKMNQEFPESKWSSRFTPGQNPRFSLQLGERNHSRAHQTNRQYLRCASVRLLMLQGDSQLLLGCMKQPLIFITCLFVLAEDTANSNPRHP